MKNKTTLALMTGAALLGGAAAGISAVASAQTTTSATTTQAPIDHKFGPGIGGKVTAVNGTTITVQNERDNTSYTVDVSSAKVLKASGTSAPATAKASDIAVGDTVMVRGTVSGTSVTATDVMDGIGPMMGRGHGKMDRGVNGTVSAVNGNTITVTAKNGTSYTVDATNAKLAKVVTISASDVKVGDTIDADGSVSGTTVTATHIMDGVPAGIR